MKLDPALFRLSASGDKQAQYRFYKQSFSLLMSICTRYTINRDDAVALLNEGFLKVLVHADKYKETVPLELWMRRIMINTAIDRFRHSKTYNEQTQHTDFSDPLSQQVTADPAQNDYQEGIESEMLFAMLQKLPPVTGKVFNLFAIDGYSHKEIAELLGMSEGTSKWHVNAARTQLKELLKVLI